MSRTPNGKAAGSSDVSALLALAQHLERLRDPRRSGLRLLRLVDPDRVRALVAVREPVEELLRLTVEDRGEVRRYVDRPRGVVQLEIDLDLVATGHPGRRPVLGAERDHEPVSYTHLRAHETGRNLV